VKEGTYEVGLILKVDETTLFERPQGAKEKGKKGNNNLDP
jgi:hypothetical protein